MSFFPQDFAIPALLKQLGGATQIQVPPLGADDEAKLRNLLTVPGVKVVISGNVWVLDATYPNWVGPIVDHNKKK